MSTFEEIKKGIPENISIPIELQKLCNWFDENGYPLSGDFVISPDSGKTMEYWFGFNNLSNKFGIFGSGPDGAIYSIWKNEEGNQRIVHLGSEGEELYVLAENFVDFLRLLAIGYDEIGYADLNITARDWNLEIGKGKDEGINLNFQEWVKKKFNVIIPEKGNEITNIEDYSFKNWIQNQIEKYSK